MGATIEVPVFPIGWTYLGSRKRYSRRYKMHYIHHEVTCGAGVTFGSTDPQKLLVMIAEFENTPERGAPPCP